MKIFYILLAVTALLSGCAGQPEKPDQSKFSGYLSQKYYDRLAIVDTPSEQVVYRYISPEFKAANYHSGIIRPVVFFPKPKPSEQVSGSTLQTLENKMTTLISSSFSKVLPVVKSPGKGVIRVETAITGVDVSNKDLQGYEYIPIALIVSGVSYAFGGRDQQVYLYLESKISDSQTNKLLAIVVRQISGEDLENAKTKLEAKQLNKGLEDAGKDFVTTLKAVFKK